MNHGPVAIDCLCQDCVTLFSFTGNPGDGRVRCPGCRSLRGVSHPELKSLSIAHLDCDAFYASIEKRDDPSLRGKPVIVGGGNRGVVSAACYTARVKGVRSAMPMFKARKLCPDAVVIPPNMKKYAAVGREVRELMREVTPLVEPLSIDEAFLDLSGTERLHRRSAAESVASLVQRIEKEIGISASIGLSFNKFLAKIASDLDKPRGFAVIGKAEAVTFLAHRPVGLIYGVGKSLREKLERDGITRIGQLRDVAPDDLVRRYGSIGERLHRFANGVDHRRVSPESETKSISSETTFDSDLDSLGDLETELWAQTERLHRRLRDAGLGGRTVTLKLKTRSFKTVTRSRQLSGATQLSEDIYGAAKDMLAGEADGRAFRLLGVGMTNLVPETEADLPDLADPGRERRRKIEGAIDTIADRFGDGSLVRGRGMSRRPQR
ncbi:MAG: DNA polymerase IV [Rhodospirillales bacterium]